MIKIANAQLWVHDQDEATTVRLRGIGRRERVAVWLVGMRGLAMREGPAARLRLGARRPRAGAPGKPGRVCARR